MLLKIGIFVLGSLFLLLPALINGFPLVYADTSTYIASGFQLETPFDRPITYGIFLRVFSLNGASAWFVIWAQSLIVTILLYLLATTFASKKSYSNWTFLGLITWVSLFSSLAWTTSQLIADIFTSVSLLAITLLIVKPHPKLMRLFLYTLFILASASHLSHITINILLLSLILVARALNIFQLKKSIALPPLLYGLALSFLVMATMGSALGKSKHGFLMGALVEHGIAKTYLDEHCEEIDYAFCTYKDSLPAKAWDFLWNDESPFYKLGGWKGTKDEFNAIIKGTLTKPKYILLHIQASLLATGDQLLSFQIGDGNNAFQKSSPLFLRLEKYFSQAADQYSSSLQAKEKLTFLGIYNQILSIIVYASFFILSLSLVLKGRQTESRQLTIVLILLMGILVNAWACGTLANAIDRLGAKMIWILPLVSYLHLHYIWEHRRFSTKEGMNNSRFRENRST